MYVLNVLFDDRFGGSSKRVTQVARYLSTHEDVHTLLCLPEGDGNTAEVAREMGVPVTRIGFERIPRPSDVRRVLRWIFRLPGDVRRFLALYRRERSDAVHVNGAFFLPPAIAAKLARVPLVWHLNDTVIPKRVAPFFGTLVRLMADRVLATSEDVARHYGVADSPHDVMPPPVDPRCFEVVWTPRKDGPRRIGLVANWNPLKGVEYFVRAAALVRERLEDIEVVFAGARLGTHAEYAREVDALIDELGLRPAVHEYGFVPSVAPVLAGLDVLVMTSTAEASSMPVLEAMAVGAPSVASDAGGVRELLHADPKNPAGVVVPIRDPEATATAVLDLLGRPEEAARMGRNGRRLAGERFSLEACAGRHLEAYAGAARRRADATR
ncbi:glycosyltransferase family 4 protein [Rubrobacter marinus]|uniref:glycosyltransferase family 4 protein n=1 Tax=Rubrobacter marinus TaxID=2653852 RepID=UPI00140862AC|nr:glycosyltransferase family 4 protein [Rubrobacter marinus]